MWYAVAKRERRAVGNAASPLLDSSELRRGRVREHVQLVGILWMAYSAFSLIGGLFLIVIAQKIFGPRVPYSLWPTALDHRPFAEGLAAVKRSGAWGYVNLKGEEIVAPQYSKVRPFAEGLAAVRRSGMWGYLNTRGEEAVVPQFMQAGDFKNGTARVCTGNPYHAFIIDRTGNKVRDVPLGGK